MRKLIAGMAAWVLGVTALHLAWNVDWAAAFNERLPLARRKLNVAYIPVT
jgi:hypothetical protein